MGDKRKPLRAAGHPKRELTKPPAPVSEDQWRKRVSKALAFKPCKNPPDAERENEVNECLRLKIDFSRQLAEAKSDPWPSEKREKKFKTRLPRLDRAAQFIREELLPSNLSAAPIPGKPGQHYQQDGLSLDARVAWHYFQRNQLGEMMPALEQFFYHAAGGPTAFNDMAEHVEQTLHLLEALTAHYNFINSTTDSDLAGVDYRVSEIYLKHFYVFDLMKVYCDLRKEQIDKVPIGNAESTSKSDVGSEPNPNPLLRFLDAAVAPIAGSQFPADDWIRPGTLRSDAMAVRTKARKMRRGK